MNTLVTRNSSLFPVALAAATTAFAVPEASNVTMIQNIGNCQVTITYELSEDAVITLDILTNGTANAETGWASIGGEHICNAQGDVWKQVSAGTHTITWQPAESWLDGNGDGFKIADGCAVAEVSAWPLDNTPDYMVVDISSTAQQNTQRYYPRVDFLPGSEPGQKGAVTNNPIYKTSMLVMRKIMAKDITWTTGATASEPGGWTTTSAVTLTNNFYIGVFEVTQSQWSEIGFSSAFSTKYTVEGSMRPKDNVCYNEVRHQNQWPKNNESPYEWPNDPWPNSFLGKLRTRTGIDFDVPSAYEWEFAARAGNGSGYWGDGSAILSASVDANLSKQGRYSGNAPGNNVAEALPSEGGSDIVGRYRPNAWGLYDVFGNVWEITRTINGDWNRRRKGGHFLGTATVCRPASDDSSTFLSCGSTGETTGLRVICRAGLK